MRMRDLRNLIELAGDGLRNPDKSAEYFRRIRERLEAELQESQAKSAGGGKEGKVTVYVADKKFPGEPQPREIQATIYGPAAVHRMVDNGRMWAVTCVTSGEAYVSSVKRKAAAVSAARAISETLGDDGSREAIERNIDKILEIVKRARKP